MSLDARTIALRGVGYGPMAMAMLGLRDAPAQQTVMDVGGGIWPFVYPKDHKTSPAHLRRTRRARDAELLWMHRL